MQRGTLTACLAAVAAGCSLAAAPVARATTAPAARAAIGRVPVTRASTVRVGGPASGVAPTSTTRGFLGISAAVETVPSLSGPATDTDRPFVRLLKDLSPGAPFVLRVGGTGADDSWWPLPGLMERYLYQLTPRWAGQVKALLTALGGTAILGLNLENDNPQLAATEVANFERYIGPNLIDAFELGNEPEFFPGEVVRAAGVRHYEFARYGAQFARVAAALGTVPLAGPSTGSPHWLPQLGTVLSDMRTPLKLVTVHAYPLKNCSSLAHLSVSDLFTRSSIQGLAETVHAAVVTARADGDPLRVDEMTGVTCGGWTGVSNSFGEALWALNVLPALWRAGVQGVNFQTVNARFNQLFAAWHGAAGWRVAVQPEYYGLLAFAQAAPAGSRLLHSSARGLAGLYQYAVRAPDGTDSVVLTNVGAAARTVRVVASGTHGRGRVSLLSARSLSEVGGVTLQGRHLVALNDDVTLGGRQLSATTGRLAGHPRLTGVLRSAGGAYTVQVPAHSAAILTVMARPSTGA